ncbi:MAG: 16S rRNA (guanine(966)-N(2))-methyltransferase RsmD [Deltaproteobacteria bacterium HGW-Deltaproteobacteria-4]|nr:MAG: 16S rRNA (guanine(966)-N(2))-methyltransferase RsmD [Deltaproteobacteria bacterium HGW-Deltaproteobacteria-4]
MRIISGRARGKKLVEFAGAQVRPTADRIREALFSILTSRLGSLQGCKVLDLFAGTGALALEALSRGAQSALLLEVHPESIKIIQTNIEGCRMQDSARVLRGELPAALPLAVKSGPFELIFLDPPYAQGLAQATLMQIAALELLSTIGIIVVETAKGEILPEKIGSLLRTDQRHYGVSSITFFERTTSPA